MKNETVDEFRKLLFREFGEFAIHDIVFMTQEEAIAFWNGLSFVSPHKEGAILGLNPDNMMMRVVRYSSCVHLMIAGHLAVNQNYEIMYATQKRLKSGRLASGNPLHDAAVKSRESSVARALIAASQGLTSEHPEFFLSNNDHYGYDTINERAQDALRISRNNVAA